MNSGGRLTFIDALKAVASQLIVLHHLAFYGPMSDHAQSLAPGVLAWLYDYARIAVQAFLVMGGYLAAQALARDGQLTSKPLLSLLWRRYLKLVVPYVAALLLAIVAAAIARRLMDDINTPALPTIPQILAHLLLLQSILGFEGLSAGVWYVAIDFQLYAFLLITLWLARHLRPTSRNLGLSLVLGLLIVSLFHFNRDASMDNWAIYFFGSYGLGALTYWAVRRGATPFWLLLVYALVAAALIIEYRLRIAVALAVAIAITAARHTGMMERWPQSKTIAWLGQISYSVFLVHYPVSLVINALFERFAPHSPEIQLGGMFVAWLASIGGGALFYRQVECRAQELLR